MNLVGLLVSGVNVLNRHQDKPLSASLSGAKKKGTGESEIGKSLLGNDSSSFPSENQIWW